MTRSVFGFSEEDVHCNHLFVNAAFGGCEKMPAEYKDTKRHVMNELYKGFREGSNSVHSRKRDPQSSQE